MCFNFTIASLLLTNAPFSALNENIFFTLHKYNRFLFVAMNLLAFVHTNEINIDYIFLEDIVKLCNQLKLKIVKER